MSSFRFAVTGASGYIGERLLRRLGDGHVALSRRAPIAPAQWIAYDLATPPPALPQDVAAVVHLAADLRNMLSPHQEQEAVRALIGRAGEVGARFIFVSSQSAGNPVSTYGRRKSDIERIVRDSGGVVVRPGFVYGGRRRAGRRDMLETLASLPAAPDFGQRLVVQPIHVDVLADVIIAIGRGAGPAHPVIQLGQDAVPIAKYTQALRAATGRPAQMLLPAPRAGLRVIAAMSRDGLPGSVRQMLALAPLDDCTEEFGLSHPELAVALSPSTQPLRRALIIEARTLLRSVAKGRFSGASARAYVRAVEASRDPRPLDARLRRRAHFAPADTGDPDAGLFNQRLMLAVTLFEFSRAGAGRLIRLKATGWLPSIMRLGIAVMVEVLVMGGVRWKPGRPS